MGANVVKVITLSLTNSLIDSGISSTDNELVTGSILATCLGFVVILSKLSTAGMQAPPLGFEQQAGNQLASADALWGPCSGQMPPISYLLAISGPDDPAVPPP
jgi:hypothetical protein